MKRLTIAASVLLALFLALGAFAAPSPRQRLANDRRLYP